ncbi:hypothetical protein, partial [Staphylococcus pseudintermedius]|uniref:hypothetical protein n=1 Tax=Staphylococcus pseudintermedius TaxID=283734 RepID=UPI001A8C8A3E
MIKRKMLWINLLAVINNQIDNSGCRYVAAGGFFILGWFLNNKIENVEFKGCNFFSNRFGTEMRDDALLFLLLRNI